MLVIIAAIYIDFVRIIFFYRSLIMISPSMESNDRQDHYYLLYSYQYSYVIEMVLLEKK